MNKLNQFFKKLYSSPSLLWKACASFLFISMGAAVVAMPSLTGQSSAKTRVVLGGIIFGYGLLRFFTFYMEFKNTRDD